MVDCANGATYHIAPNVLRELGANVIAIGCEPNGVNINAEVGQLMFVRYRRAYWLKKQILVSPLTVTATA